LAGIADKMKKMTRATSMKNISNAVIAGIMVSFYIILLKVKIRQGPWKLTRYLQLTSNAPKTLIRLALIKVC
jgi:hypothetical protein